MAPKRIKKPRKKPKQERAQQTVEALLEATAQVLVKEGYHRASTNRIAARAGTSIGTLYEYFPSKDALIAATVESYAEDVIARMQAKMDVALARPQAESVRFWVEAMVDVLEEKAGFVRVLVTQVPFMWEIPLIRALQRRLEEIASQRGSQIRALIGADFTPESVFLMTSIMKSTVVQIATDRPKDLDRDLLIDEFSELFTEHFLRKKARFSPQRTKPAGI